MKKTVEKHYVETMEVINNEIRDLVEDSINESEAETVTELLEEINDKMNLNYRLIDITYIARRWLWKEYDLNEFLKGATEGHDYLRKCLDEDRHIKDEE